MLLLLARSCTAAASFSDFFGDGEGVFRRRRGERGTYLAAAGLSFALARRHCTLLRRFPPSPFSDSLDVAVGEGVESCGPPLSCTPSGGSVLLALLSPSALTAAVGEGATCSSSSSSIVLSGSALGMGVGVGVALTLLFPSTAPPYRFTAVVFFLDGLAVLSFPAPLFFCVFSTCGEAARFDALS